MRIGLSIALYLLALTVSILAFPGFAADAGDLIGRWESSGQESGSAEYRALQFEKSGKLYIEANEKGSHTILALEYRIEAEQLFIPRISKDEAIQFEFVDQLLNMTFPGSAQASFRKVKKTRAYLSVAMDSDMRMLQVEVVDINVEIFGSRAITNAIYTIKNNYHEDVEANLQLPLPEGASVVGYSLDIAGAMVSGVAVPKVKARQVFEKTEDQKAGLDIAETIRGNRFNTRVYPVPARGVRKVGVNYVQSLERTLVGSYDYIFPFSLIDSGAAINLTVSADSMAFIPIVKKSPFAEPKWDEANSAQRYYLADALPPSAKRIDLLKDMVLRVYPLNESSGVISRAQDGFKYYFAQLKLDDDLLTNMAGQKNVTVFWDASASMESKHKSNYRVLAQFLKIKKRKQENVNLNLMVFANEVILQKSYRIGGPEDSLLLQQIKTIRYGGATNYDPVINANKVNDTDYILFFSDGISSLGKQPPLQSPVPVYAICGDSEKNHPWLYGITRQSKGLLLNVDALGAVPAVDLIGKQLPEFNIRMPDGSKSMQSSSWVEVGDDITISVAGRLEPDQENIEGNIVFAAGDLWLYSAPLSQQAVGGFAKYDWLRLQLNNLLVNSKINEEAITKLGMENALVTPFTALKVLENIDDYVRYGVAPPKTFPEANKYDNLRSAWLREGHEKQDEQATPEKIVAWLGEEWKERQEWWAKSKKQSSEEVIKLLSEEKEKSSESDESDLLEAAPVRGLDSASSDPQDKIVIKPRLPDRPYLKKLNKAASKDNRALYKQYLSERKTYGDRPSFYMDVAQFFIEHGLNTLAVRILSNVLELHPENVELERIVANKLIQFGEYDAAISVLEHVALLRPYQAASTRDLALVWEKKASVSKVSGDFQKALDYYYETVMGPGDTEEQLRLIALMEVNHLVNKLKELKQELEFPELDTRFLKPTDVDIRIVLSWNSRVADLDLSIEEPSGERVSYQHSKSLGGGYLPFDDNDGFGPEEYLARFAPDGDYKVLVDLSARNSLDLFGPLDLTLDVYTDYGRKSESLKTTTVQLSEDGESIEVGVIQYHRKESQNDSQSDNENEDNGKKE